MTECECLSKVVALYYFLGYLFVSLFHVALVLNAIRRKGSANVE